MRTRLTPEERWTRRLESHRRYNGSAKGQARDKRYELKHPERKGRWEAARNAKPRDLGGGGGAVR